MKECVHTLCKWIAFVRTLKMVSCACAIDIDALESATMLCATVCCCFLELDINTRPQGKKMRAWSRQQRRNWPYARASHTQTTPAASLGNGTPKNGAIAARSCGQSADASGADLRHLGADQRPVFDFETMGRGFVFRTHIAEARGRENTGISAPSGVLLPKPSHSLSWACLNGVGVTAVVVVTGPADMWGKRTEGPR